MDGPEKSAEERSGKLAPDVAAKAEEYGARLFRAFSSLYSNEKVKKVKELSVRAGYSSTYLHKILNGSRKITLDVLLQVIAAANDPLERLLRRLALPCPGNEGLEEPLLMVLASPAALLEEWREKPETPDPFLAEVGEWVEELRLREKERWPVALPLRQVVLSLEEERLRDWRWTKKQLERRGREHWNELRAKSRLALGSLGELAVLLAAWAATQRVAGHRGNATDALGFAFELAETAADSWAYAFCLQKAAYLAHDLGHDLEALAFVQRGTLLLGEDCSIDDLARNTIDRGYFSYQLGRVDRAENLLRAGLAKLGPHQRLYRFTAYQALAQIAREKGELETARRDLREAANYCAGKGLEAAYVAWTAAGIEQAAKAFSSAEEYLQQAIRLFAQHGRAGDIAFVALDHMELLLELQRLDELRKLAVEVAGWLAPLAADNSCLLEVFEDIAAVARLGTLSSHDLENARGVCEKEQRLRELDQL